MNSNGTKMEKETETVVGLDIGTYKIAAVVGELNRKGELVIKGVGVAASTGVVKGEVRNIDQTVSGIMAAIEEAGAEAHVDIDTVNVNVSVSAFKIRPTMKQSLPIEGNIIKVQDLERLESAVKREANTAENSVVHIIPQHYKVGNTNNLPDPVGVMGTHLEGQFRVLTVPKLNIDCISDCLSKVRPRALKIEHLVFSPLAASLSMLEQDEKESGVALVDIGCGKTEVVIYHDNVVRYFAVIGIGGDAITEDIAAGCQIRRTLAENLKIKLGNALPETVSPNEVVAVTYLANRPTKDISLFNLSIIIQERLLEIAALVNYEIKRSGMSDQLIGGIVLTGGTSTIEGIDNIFHQVTGKHVVVKNPNLKVSPDTAHKINSPIFATAVGLVWRGFRELDFRDERHKHSQHNSEKPQSEVSSSSGRNEPVRPVLPSKTGNSGGLSSAMRNLLRLGKEILTDDIKDVKFQDEDNDKKPTNDDSKRK